MTHQSQKVLVAMSGGVDSSVAAALLCEAGYDVVGISMNLLTCHRPKEDSCCSAQDRRDAAAVAKSLGIPHVVVDYRADFRKQVIDPFVEEYLAGRTPSPCIRCNEYLKFGALFAEADRLGCEFLSTGHYARVEHIDDRFRLRCGIDPSKDQSYFLFILKQPQLKRLLLPLGGMTKFQVRDLAQRLSLPVHEKPESQEICFVPDDDYVAFVEERAGARMSGPGDFVDTEGNVLGRHRGIHAYTIGQRRGLGVSAGKRRYVVRIDSKRNQVVLGDDADLMCTSMIVRDISWTQPSNADIKRARVRVRSTDAGEMATLVPQPDGAIEVRFDAPVRAIAPGQAAVFSHDDEVIGGGWMW